MLEEDRYDLDPLLDEAITFIHPDEVPDIYGPNPYVSIAAGHTYVLRAGEEGEETVIVHVTEDTREILGVDCSIVADIVVEVDEDRPQAFPNSVAYAATLLECCIVSYRLNPNASNSSCTCSPAERFGFLKLVNRRSAC